MTDAQRQRSRFTAIFAGGTMISRVTGLVREMAITAFMPVGARDAFYFAFRLPNMLRDLVGEGASNAAFVPVLSGVLEKDKEAAFRELTSALMSAMIVLLGAITVLGVLLMPLIAQFLDAIAPYTHGRQFSPEESGEVIGIARWLFPYIFFIGLTVFQMGPLFIKHHYSTPSWSPALLNVCLILTCWLMRDWFGNPAYALVVGVWLGGIAQLAVQNLAMRKHVGVWLPNFHLRHPGIRQALWLLLPVILGQSAGEVNKFIDMTVAYSLGEGVQSALWVSNIIVQLPLAMFGIAISVAILPSISRAAAREEFDEIRETLKQGLRQCYFLTVPAVVALVVCPEPIVRLLFQRGHFTDADTIRTSIALAYLSPGLLFFGWVKVSVAGFYGIKNTRTPVAIAFVSMLANIALILALVRFMDFRCLPLATTLSYGMNFGLLYLFLSRRYGVLWDRHAAFSLSRITFAGAVMAVVLHYAEGYAAGVVSADNLATRLLLVLGPLGVGAGVYAASCLAMNVPEFKIFASLVHRRTADQRAGQSRGFQ